MDFLDDEADASGAEDILVRSSQPSQGYRPNKRRRLNNGYNKENEEADDEAAADQYELPSNNESDEAVEDAEDLERHRSKYEDRMHVPEYAETQRDTFVTQADQPWSSPTRMRGPRWKKQVSPIRPPPRSEVVISLVQAPTAAHSVGAHELPRPPPPPLPANPDDGDEDFGSDDSDLLEAFLSSDPQEREVQEKVVDCPSVPERTQQTTRGSFRQTTLFSNSATQQEIHGNKQTRGQMWRPANSNEAPTHHSIDTEAMKTWVYPTNLGRIRDYQYNIVHKGLFNNLLVALPTGLGKTFIAATVMLNWFRWTTKAQMVFVAPTKPLVAQQMEACFNVVGIPRSQTAMLTGETSTLIRDEDWAEKRVFFMTPQTLINDLKHGRADPKKIVLIVVDEAHKATGSYAYVEVVKFMRRFTSSFRVLALTATPGGSVEAVQTVIDGLDISRVEIRTEDSLDIRSFVYSRNVSLELFDYSDEQETCLELFRAAVNPLLTRLRGVNLFGVRDAAQITQFGMLKAEQEWKKSQAGANKDGQYWGIKHAFKPLITLGGNLNLLMYHGIGPFYHKMKEFEESAGGQRDRARLVIDSEPYKKMMNYMRAWVNKNDFEGHPKLTYLKSVVLNHFMDASEGHRSDGRGPAETRIMIFAHFRSSAEEIVRVLKQHEMIRPCVFVGQSGSKDSQGMNQKTQLEVISKFKSGTYNTLVATSIGEEGLDIGEVDLIVCYDASNSPIRMLQRMGRTGRKREGKIVLLLMRDKEEAKYYRAKDGYEKMQQIIESGRDFVFHHDRSPRIVPREIQPVVDKRIVEIPVENTQAEPLEPRKRKPKTTKKAPKKFHMPDGVETGFQFLGSKGGRARKKGTNPMLDLDEFPLPSLASVLLSPAEHLRLEQNYQQVEGTEPVWVTAPRMDALPKAQRSLQAISYVGHSRSTKTLVRTLNVMNSTDKDWSRTMENSFTGEIVSDTSTLQGYRRASVRRDRTARSRAESRPQDESRGVSSRTMSPNSYDAGDSFIDDETPLLDPASPSSATSPDLFVRSTTKTIVADDLPFYISQASRHLSQESDNDLPELGDVVGKHAAAESRTTQSRGDGSGRLSKRRIIDSDDDL